MRLIDADLLRQTIESKIYWGAGLLEAIDDAPAVDAVEVVLCKDCKHYMTIHCTCDGCCISDYWFCADGERRADDGK